jgi:hypothetical protein
VLVEAESELRARHGFATVKLNVPVPRTARTRTLWVRWPQIVVEREIAPEPTTRTTRLDEAKTSSARRRPAEGLRVTFIVPSSCVGTV